VNIAKKQFNHVNNEYEITFEPTTEIEPVSFVLAVTMYAERRSATMRVFRRSNMRSRELVTWENWRKTRCVVCLLRP